jgi:hypothetical protein
MAANDLDYGTAQKSAELGAMGYDKDGHRGGGIDNPRLVKLKEKAIHMRLYMPPEPGKPLGDFGEWWITPFEYRRICNYFGVDGRALLPGRHKGRSAFHGVLALLKEWYGNSPAQLCYVNVVELNSPLAAYYGCGAPANTENYARTLKPVRLENGTPARQVYIHQCWKYKSAMKRLVDERWSAESFFGNPSGLPIQIRDAPKLYFE